MLSREENDNPDIMDKFDESALLSPLVDSNIATSLEGGPKSLEQSMGSESGYSQDGFEEGDEVGCGG